MQAEPTGNFHRTSLVVWSKEMELLINGLELLKERAYPPEDEEDRQYVDYIDQMLAALKFAQAKEV